MAGLDFEGFRPRIRKLEDRLLLSATPEAAVADLPDTQLINEGFDFTVEFDNTGSDPQGTGFTPFVDVTAGPGATINGATYLGSAVGITKIADWDGTQWIDSAGDPVTDHPYDKLGGVLELPVGTIEGQAWYLVQTPFGSYGPDQPSVPLVFSASLDESPDPSDPDAGAIPGTPIEITARAGFRFGLDALDNPSTDPPLQQATTVVDTITPVVMQIRKDTDLPEGETAQGPNFEFDYIITIDVADGVTVTDVDVTDLLPDNLFFVSATTSVAASAVDAPGEGGRAEGIPGLDTGATASFAFDTIVGTTSDSDVVIRLRAYAPESDAAGVDLIDTTAPSPTTATNSVSVTADYDGAPLDAGASGALADDAVAEIEPFTVLKTVQVEGGGAAVPGKYLQYTIQIDISDYQSFEDLVLTDVLSDGLSFDTTDNATLEHRPTVVLTLNGETFAYDMVRFPRAPQETEISATLLDGSAATPYGQQLEFFLSAAKRNAGGTGSFVGDLYLGDPQEGATTITLTYFARIEEAYRNPSRGPVVENDVLTNAIDSAANTSDGGGPSTGDDSGSSTSVPPPVSSKSVYAINGLIGASNEIAPGDLVTYRITIQLDSLDVDNLRIEDYLPLPIFDVDGGTALDFDSDRSGIPGAYQINKGPLDTATNIVAPVDLVSVDGEANSIIIEYADFNEVGSTGGIIDLIYTVPTQDSPYADGIHLLNQAVITIGDSTTDVALTDIETAEIVLRQPVLALTKGVVATDATGGDTGAVSFSPTDVGPSEITWDLDQGSGPAFTVSSPLTADILAASPIDSDLSGADAGDRVKFAIAVVNTGGEDAFDVTIIDAMPAAPAGRGLAVPAGGLVVDVRLGDGTQLTEDQTGALANSWSGDLFSGGIVLSDAVGAGGLAADTGDGRNIVIVSYELILDDGYAPESVVENMAEITRFASIEGGTNFTTGVDGDFADGATVESPGVALSKRLIETSEDFTPGDSSAVSGGNGVTIGETATFQLEVTIPEGETNVVITDQIPAGAALFDGTFSGDGAPVLLLSYTDAGGTPRTFDGSIDQGGLVADGGALTYSVSGQTLTITIDAAIATATSGTSNQSFAISYKLIYTDDPALAAGGRPANSAVLDTDTTDPTGPQSASVLVQEPDLSITKVFSPDVVEGGATSTTTLTIEVTNADATRVSPAWGLDFSDLDLSKDFFSAVNSAVLVSADAAVQARIDAGDITVSVVDAGDHFELVVTADDDFFLARGESIRLVADLQVVASLVAGDSLLNTVTIPDGGYSSLPGDPDAERDYGPETAQDEIKAQEPGIEKRILTTSLYNDASPDVAVGELITFQVDLVFPKGDVLAAGFADSFAIAAPAGLENMLSLVSIDSITVGTALALPDRPGGLNPSLFDTFDESGDGLDDTIELIIGEVINNATAGAPAADERIRIVYTARVMNLPEVREGEVGSNVATLGYLVPDGSGGTTQINASDDVDIAVHEPDLEIVKTSDAPAGGVDAGDVITYTLQIDSRGAATIGGYNLQIEDSLSEDVTYVAGSIAVSGGVDGRARYLELDAGDVEVDPSGAATVIRIGDIAAGADGFDLAPGDSVTVTYQVRVNDDVQVGRIVDNQATLRYQSLPESFTPPDDAEMRDGTDVDFSTYDPSDPPRDDDAVVDNFAWSDTLETAIVTPDPIVKTSDKSTYTIGELIAYQIEIPLIEGVTEGGRLVDDLPAGVSFEQTGASVEDSLTAVDGDGVELTILDARIETIGGIERLIIEFDDITLAGDNVAGNDLIRIAYSARVLNIIGNQDGDGVNNQATFEQDTDDPAAPVLSRFDDSDARLVEPDLFVTKSADVTSGFDAGDTIIYTVEVRHSAESTADAYDLQFLDTNPAKLEPIRVIEATAGGSDISADLEIVGNEARFRAGADIDLLQGQVLRLVYEVRARDTVEPGEALANFAGVSWTSLNGEENPGDARGERNFGTLTDPLNDYVDLDDELVTVEDRLTMVKSVDGGRSNFAIGETVQYLLDITFIEGTSRNVLVSDTLERGIEFVEDSLRVVDSGFGGAGPTIGGFSYTVGALTGAGQLSFTLDNDGADGTQIVNPGDNDASNNTIRIAFDAVVVNRLENQDEEELSNVAVVTATGAVAGTGSETITVVEPELTLTKTPSPAGPFDAGDEITYTLVIENTGTSTAYDIVFRDDLPAGMSVSGVVTAVDDGGSPIGTFVVTDAGGLDRIDGSAFDLAVGATATVTYTATLDSSVEDGDALANAAAVTWTSTSGINASERTGDDGEGPDDDTILDNYEVSADASIDVALTLDLDKRLVTTSLDADADPQVVIGETATFALDVKLGEGSIPGVIVTDTLPAGLVFVPGSVAATATTGTATFGAPVVAYDAASGLLTLDLGDVAVTGTADTTAGAPDFAVITLTYDAVAANALSNQDGVTLDNGASVTTGTASLGTATAGPVTLEVIEPDLEVDKSASPATFDAGDVVTYTVEVRHSADSRSDAYEVGFRDVLPAGMTLRSVVSATLGGVDVLGRFAIAGDTVSSTATLEIPQGQVLEIVYDAVAGDAFEDGDVYTNTARVDWSSLPGAVTDERDGADGEGPDATTLDNYAASDTSSVTAELTLELAKSLVTTSLDGDASPAVVVGERAEFALDVTLGEGATPSLVVTDTLPRGLSFVAGTVVVTDVSGAITVGAPVVTYDAGTRLLTIDLGDVDVAGTEDSIAGAPDEAVLRITYETLVQNVLSNQDGVTIDNAAQAASGSAGLGTATAAPVELEIVEPEISVSKSGGAASTFVDAGDVVTYAVVLENTGSAKAWDVTFSDPVPPGMTATGAVTAVDDGGAPIGLFSVIGGQIVGSGFDMEIGGTVTVTYTVTVDDTVRPGDDFVNTASARWTSLPGPSSDERTGDDGEGPDASTLDNYADSDDATIRGPREVSVAIGKALTSSSLAETSGADLAVGETGTFTLRIVLREGTLPDVVVEDALPDGMRYLPGTVAVTYGAPGAGSDFAPGGVTYDASTGRLVVRLGDVVNPGDNITANNYVDITYDAVVEDVASVSDGDRLRNVAGVFSEGVRLDTAAAAVDVVEPVLSIDKTTDKLLEAPGEQADYTIVVRHEPDSHVDAFDVVISDPFDDPRAVLDFATVTAVLDTAGGPVALTATAVGSGFRVDVPRLALGETVTVTFAATLSTDPADNASAVFNSATVDWDTLPGDPAPGEQRGYEDGDRALVIIAGPDMRLVKTASVGDVAPGDQFRYDILVENKGAPGYDLGVLELAREVVLTDVLPQGLKLLGATVDGAPVTPVFAADGRTFTIALGDMEGEETRLVALLVSVDSPAAAWADSGAEPGTLINTAGVRMKYNDPTPEDNVDDARVDIAALPDLVVTKTNDVSQTYGGRTVPFTLTVENVGNRVAAEVVVTDQVDTSVFKFVSASDGGVFDPATGLVTWTISRLSPDDGAQTFTLNLKVKGQLDGIPDTTNVVRAADDGRAGPDPTPADNADSHTDRLIYPDLAITKASSVEEVAPGDFVDYVIQVRNIGAVESNGVIVVDTVDARVFDFLSASDGGVYDPSTGTVTWRLGTVSPDDGTITLKLTLIAKLGADPSLDQAINVVEVSGDGTTGLEPDLSNNRAVETDILLPGIDPHEISSILADDAEPEEEDEEEIMLVAPVFTGQAPAGATVMVTLIGADGGFLAQASVMASESGSWMLSMPDVETGGQPVSAVVMTIPSPVRSEDHSSNAVFFSPSGQTPITFQRQYDLFDAREAESFRLMQERALAAEHPGLATARRFVNFNSAAGTSLNGG